MDLESVLTLFDSCWLNVEILKKHSNPTPLLNLQKTPDNKIQENSQETVYDDSPKLEIQIESQSDDLSYNSDSFSPDSVLPATHFQAFSKKADSKKIKGRKSERRSKTRTTKGLNKSLSELEYKELKGFKDLGFEFSEKDVNSSLVDIIPGLHKLVKNKDSDDDQEKSYFFFEKSNESRARPYLSEACEILEKKKKMNPLNNWKVPDTSNEIDIKHSLKWCCYHSRSIKFDSL